MAYDVLMPQLGMAQDTAVLVSWAKAVGDKVKTGEVLMEVETDKSTVEVEAAHDGFIVDVRAQAGSEVPVGDVIAVISENADDVVETVTEAKTNVEAEPVSPPEQEPRSTLPAAAPTNLISNDRILASPKARAEAKRSGVDLVALVQSGVRQPIHFDDVINAPDLAIEPGAGNSIVPALPALGQILLQIPRKPMDDFLLWLENERPGEIMPAAVWMSVATRAMRESGRLETDVEIRSTYHALSNDDGKLTSSNSDKTLLSSILAVPSKEPGLLEIVDLQNSAIVKFDMGQSSAPVSIVLRSTKKNLKIRCSFDLQSISTDEAIRFSSEISKVLANPILLLV